MNGLKNVNNLFDFGAELLPEAGMGRPPVIAPISNTGWVFGGVIQGMQSNTEMELFTKASKKRKISCRERHKTPFCPYASQLRAKRHTILLYHIHAVVSGTVTLRRSAISPRLLDSFSI